MKTIALVVSISAALFSVAALPVGSANGKAAASDTKKQKHVITPRDITGIRWLSSQAMSPDGKLVAFVVTEWDETTPDKPFRRSSMWLVDTDGSRPARPLALEHKKVGPPQWSPDGATLSFLSSGASKDATRQLWLLSRDGTKLDPLTRHSDSIESFQWSPDGKSIAFLAPGAKIDQRRFKDRPESDVIEIGKTQRLTQLSVVTLESRRTIAVTKADQHIVNFAWSPDSSQFAAVITSSPETMDLSTEHARLLILDRDGGVLRTLNSRVHLGLVLSWSRDGSTIVFGELTKKEIGRRLAFVPAAGGTVRYLLDDYEGYPRQVQWSHEPRFLWVNTWEGTRLRLLRLDTTSGTFERFAGTIQNFWSFSLDREERILALSAETNHSPPNLVILEAGKPPRTLTDLNPQVNQWLLGNVQDVQWKNPQDGVLIHGVLVTPPDFRPDQLYPTIVEIHGGPQDMWWNGWFGTYLARGQYLASRGYVVLLPNFRGSLNRGVDFVEANFRDWGGGDFHDVMAGVDLLIERKIADPLRLGIGGTSYGGYLTAWSTTQTQRFQAAIVECGSVDLITFTLSNDANRPLRAFLGGDEFRDREFFLSRSPLTHIQRCTTPTLVLHGDKDERVPLAQGWLWHRGLKLLGVETEMAVYPGGGHGFTERHQHEDVMLRVLDWYDRHLKRPEKQTPASK